MRFLPTRVHGALDYLVAALLLATPWLFSLPTGTPTYIPVLLGIVTVAYSIHTEYEWGLIRAIPMRVHLVIDLLNGLFFASAPWLFGFHSQVWKPFLIIGLTELLVTAVSSPHTSHLRASTR